MRVCGALIDSGGAEANDDDDDNNGHWLAVVQVIKSE